MIWIGVCAFACLAWAVILFGPAQAHRTRERLEPRSGRCDLGAVSVLIPARNEASVIGRTLAALARQGAGLDVVVVDDLSSDATAEVCRAHAERRGGKPECGDAASMRVRLIHGAPLPSGWGGKLWALQQGMAQLRRPYTLLLDADIELAPGMIRALLELARGENLALVSIMAKLRCTSFWERLLAPAFVFFFKLIYPFSKVNARGSAVAAAAGGCMLIDTAVLRESGAFETIRDALIDDCALAEIVKERGHPIRLLLSCSVRSLRPYRTLRDFWMMVSRTAYTQLGYSPMWLVLTSALMLIVFVGPLLGAAFAASSWTLSLGGCALLGMSLAYLPVVRFYGLPSTWAASLPFAAVVLLAMTWSSALSYWRGTRATWKNRAYEVSH